MKPQIADKWIGKPSPRLPDLKATEIETLGHQNSTPVKTELALRPDLTLQGLDLASSLKLTFKSATCDLQPENNENKQREPKNAKINKTLKTLRTS